MVSIFAWQAIAELSRTRWCFLDGCKWVVKVAVVEKEKLRIQRGLFGLNACVSLLPAAVRGCEVWLRGMNWLSISESGLHSTASCIAPKAKQYRDSSEQP